MERREFLQNSLQVTAATTLGTVAFLKVNRSYWSENKSAPPEIPLVVRSRLNHQSQEDSPTIGPYLSALDHGVALLTGERGLAAYKKLFPRGKVAIKVNCASILNPNLSLIDALLKRLSDIGIKKVVIWDRFAEDLSKSGYPIQKVGNYKFIGTDSLDQAYPKSPEIFPFCLPQQQNSALKQSEPSLWDTSFSNILWEQCDHLISIAVLKDHARCGVSLTMKNTYGMIHNPHKLHDHQCYPYLLGLNQHPLLRMKTKLFLIDAHRGQYHGGPQWNSQYLFYPQVLYLSRSALAIDQEGWKVIENERHKAGLVSLASENRTPLYLQEPQEPGWQGYRLVETSSI
ncbi:MAG: DUF362 domain-containing protein [Planctomycetota bacterium]